MMSYEGIPIEELEQRVEAREALIERYSQFMEDITRKRGKVLAHKVHSDHTYNKRELRGFEGFSFLVETGLSMMGTEYFTAWYHPGKEEVDFEATDPVLIISGATLRVQTFNEDPEWQTALNGVIEGAEEIVDRIDREQKEDEQARAEELRIEAEEEVKRRDLIERATNLKM